MSAGATISWWLEQVEATRRAVESARDHRRGPSGGGTLDEEQKRRAVRVAPLPVARPAHVILRGATITGAQDEERRRSLRTPSAGGAGAGAASTARPVGQASTMEGGGGFGAGNGAVTRARQLAAGYQPAVVKIVSYARGAARATATGHYVQRDDVPLETHDGRMLIDKDAVTEEIKTWSQNFSRRAESQDVTEVRLKLHGIREGDEGREAYQRAVASGFAGHRHAYRLDVTPAGELEARVVVAMAGISRERFRVRDERIGTGEQGFVQRRLDAPSEAAIKARIEQVIGYPAHAISIAPGAVNHGKDGVTYRLNALTASGPAFDDSGKTLANVADARVAAREWGPSLRSQSARDTLHLILSAKAGTDVEALKDTARAFLHDRFGDHRFMFGVHTDKESEGHIHAHAVITVKNESGQKIHPGKETFKAWREAYAEHAQAQGLKIVATAARERASSQSYGPRDKAIVETAERPRPAREARDRAYANDPANQRLIDNARQRVELAKANPIRLPVTEIGRSAIKQSTAAWKTIAREQPENVIARTVLERLLIAKTVGNIIFAIGKRAEPTQKEDQAMAITSRQMVKDLNLMNEAVSRASDLLEGQTRQQFQQRAALYMETLANRIDLQRLQERGVQQLSRSEVEAIAGANADRLIARAQEVRAKEAGEAVSAQKLADRAVEIERRSETAPRTDPASLQELRVDREAVAATEQSAAMEMREAHAAVEAARQISQHPAQKLSPGLVQTDALARLRAEQEQIIRQLEAERVQAQGLKGHRLKE